MIKVSNLSKCYQIYANPSDRLKQALWRGKKQFYQAFWPLQDVSFEIGRGEVVGLIGANGSGKSTLLQLVCGILQPTSGSVHVDGRIAALLELGSGFNPQFTGHDNLHMNAALLGLSKAELNERYQDIVDFAGIGDFIHQPVKTYSSGMVIRLAFAISSFVNADVLVVDEALAVGDASFQAKCLERMERLMQQGTTILLVTHDAQMVKKYCDRVLYLRQGRLVYDGDAEEGTEIYLHESREQSAASHAISRKINNDASLAFGSAHGEITRVELSAGGQQGRSVVVKQGERVTLDISAWADETVQHPSLQMTVRDRRGYNLYGFNQRYGGQTLERDEQGLLRVRYSFDARLQAGQYIITVRLDNSSSPSSVELVDKRVGIADFVVSAPEKRFDAVLDLDGRCEVIN
jgi:lipopolysaccharide transport system ATP-binding protein